MKAKTILVVLALILGTTLLRASDVAIIAHSVSTSMEAHKILARFKWREVQLKQADGILVVCRSMLFNPLRDSYDDIGSLDKDADMQLNISGENFHVYIYKINDDLSVRLVKHFSYKAD